MFARVTVRLTLLAACAAAPAAAQVEGQYLLHSLNGQPLPAASPTEDGLTIHRACVNFQPDGEYTAQALADEGDGLRKDDVEGTWRVEGDSVILVLLGFPDMARIAYAFRLRDSKLHLFEESGDEYVLVRAAAAPAQLHEEKSLSISPRVRGRSRKDAAAGRRCW